MAKAPADRIAAALEALEAGFPSEAARKRALDNLNRAYSTIQEAAFDAICTAARGIEGDPDAQHALFRENELPFDLHQVRDRHFPTLERFGAQHALVRDLIALRATIKAADIKPAPQRDPDAQRAEIVRKTILEELQHRKEAYVQGLDIARLLGGLAVTVNAHLVYGHKRAIFTRSFFYLNGQLTALRTILAIAGTFERERKEAEAKAS